MTEKIILYGHTLCPMIPPVVGMLKLSKVDYLYIDIHGDSVGAARVREINQGNESVPTLVFPDGSTLTEPSEKVLRTKLEETGYTISWGGRLAMHAWLIVIALGVGLALFRLLHP